MRHIPSLNRQAHDHDQHLSACGAAEFVEILGGIHEHSPWIAQRAAAQRPFASLTALKQAMQGVVTQASEEEQLHLVRAHPELAGKAAIAGQLTKESTGEQAKAGLNNCSPEEFAALQRLNADYNAKFGFPFILAVKGPDGKGLTRQQIIATFTRRLKNCRDDELAEDLRQIHRIAELRLNDLLGYTPALGNIIMEWSEVIGAWSDDDGGLTCAYLTMAHRKTAAQLAAGAAKEIKALISNSVEKVEAGSRLVDEAGETMSQIVASFKRVADIMSEISAASQEQSTGIEEINRAIAQMDEMTQQNAALVEQAAAAAQSMQDQAANLARTVSVFNLGANGQERPAMLALR